MTELPLDFIKLEAINPYTKDSDPNPIYVRAGMIRQVEPFTGPYQVLMRTPNNQAVPSEDKKMITDGSLIIFPGDMGNRISYDTPAEVMAKMNEAINRCTGDDWKS